MNAPEWLRWPAYWLVELCVHRTPDWVFWWALPWAGDWQYRHERGAVLAADGEEGG